MTEKQYLKIQDRLCKETVCSVFDDTINWNLLYEFLYKEGEEVLYGHVHDFRELLGTLAWYVYNNYEVQVNETCSDYSPSELRCVQEWIEYLENLDE